MAPSLYISGGLNVAAAGRFFPIMRHDCNNILQSEQNTSSPMISP
jgi:hypothetical protein